MVCSLSHHLHNNIVSIYNVCFQRLIGLHPMLTCEALGILKQLNCLYAYQAIELDAGAAGCLFIASGASKRAKLTVLLKCA